MVILHPLIIVLMISSSVHASRRRGELLSVSSGDTPPVWETPRDPTTPTPNTRSGEDTRGRATEEESSELDDSFGDLSIGFSESVSIAQREDDFLGATIYRDWLDTHLAEQMSSMRLHGHGVESAIEEVGVVDVVCKTLRDVQLASTSLMEQMETAASFPGLLTVVVSAYKLVASTIGSPKIAFEAATSSDSNLMGVFRLFPRAIYALKQLRHPVTGRRSFRNFSIKKLSLLTPEAAFTSLPKHVRTVLEWDAPSEPMGLFAKSAGSVLDILEFLFEDSALSRDKKKFAQPMVLALFWYLDGATFALADIVNTLRTFPSFSVNAAEPGDLSAALAVFDNPNLYPESVSGEVVTLLRSRPEYLSFYRDSSFAALNTVGGHPVPVSSASVLWGVVASHDRLIGRALVVLGYSKTSGRLKNFDLERIDAFADRGGEGAIWAVLDAYYNHLIASTSRAAVAEQHTLLEQ